MGTYVRTYKPFRSVHVESHPYREMYLINRADSQCRPQANLEANRPGLSGLLGFVLYVMWQTMGQQLAEGSKSSNSDMHLSMRRAPCVKTDGILRQRHRARSRLHLISTNVSVESKFIHCFFFLFYKFLFL